MEPKNPTEMPKKAQKPKTFCIADKLRQYNYSVFENTYLTFYSDLKKHDFSNAMSKSSKKFWEISLVAYIIPCVRIYEQDV